MSNTAIHIRNTVKHSRDKMGWILSVSVAEVLFVTLEIGRHSPTRVLLPSLESMESKGHIHKLLKLFNERTFTYKITEVQQ